MGDDAEWRLDPHSQLRGYVAPPDAPHPLHFPRPDNQDHETTHKTMAFAPDDSCLARIVGPKKVIVNEFDGDCGGTFGPDKVINLYPSQAQS